MHSKAYQRLLNSKRWRKEIRPTYLASHPYCERCLQKDPPVYRSAVDIHHIQPIEGARSPMEMEHRAYSLSNLQALCVACHIEVHKEAKSHTKQGHQQREADRLAQWKARHQPRATKNESETPGGTSSSTPSSNRKSTPALSS